MCRVNNNYKYTIAMVNLNMETTIQQSILSIYNQLDENFEILVVDGGSVDKSIEKVKNLQFFLKNLRLIELKRDKKRLLGDDRNISISESNGEYVLLHLDCDDIYAPFIKSWVKIYHILEKVYGDDNLIMGQHINMAKKETLINDPYKNLQMEDRELWIRYLRKGKLIEIDHIDIAYRIEKAKSKRYHEAIYRNYRFCVQDLTDYPYGFFRYFKSKIFGKNIFTLRIRILNLILMPFVFATYTLKIKKNQVYDKDEFIKTSEKWQAFRKNKTTIKELLKSKNFIYDFKEFTELEKKIFKIN